jgi:hypothetical protein
MREAQVESQLSGSLTKCPTHFKFVVVMRGGLAAIYLSLSRHNDKLKCVGQFAF